MYEELVMRLRECTAEQNGEKTLWHQAADAIEELIRDRKRGRWINTMPDFDLCGVAYYKCSECGREQQTPSKYCQFCGARMEGEMIVQRSDWIPVTECSPEECDELNWYEGFGIRSTSVLCCDCTTGRCGIRNRFQRTKTGFQRFDGHSLDTDWHWSDASWKPSHWMPIAPLPEPPKEQE